MMAAIIQRLEAEAMPPLRSVKGGAEFAALKAPPPKPIQPAAFVVPATSAGGVNALAAGGFRQPLRESFHVMIAMGNLGDARGEAAALDLAEVRDAVRQVLAGWSPGKGWTACELVSGGLIDITEGVLTWRDTFVSAGHLRVTTTG